MREADETIRKKETEILRTERRRELQERKEEKREAVKRTQSMQSSMFFKTAGTILETVKDTGLQLLYPRRCPICDNIIPQWGEKICLTCLPKLKFVAPPRCLKCGKGLKVTKQEYCGDCAHKHHYYVSGRALYEYGSVADSLYRLKYEGRQEYAQAYGDELARYLGDFIKRVKPDALIPIPLHWTRKGKRGYNQAALLAKSLGKQVGVPVKEKVLIRVRKTAPMKLLNPVERQNNLKKAFLIRGNDVKLKTVIIVDDIYTTGATIDEAARTLLEAGVEKIYFVTLAVGG